MPQPQPDFKTESSIKLHCQCSEKVCLKAWITGAILKNSFYGMRKMRMILSGKKPKVLLSNNTSHQKTLYDRLNYVISVHNEICCVRQAGSKGHVRLLASNFQTCLTKIDLEDLEMVSMIQYKFPTGILGHFFICRNNMWPSFWYDILMCAFKFVSTWQILL